MKPVVSPPHFSIMAEEQPKVEEVPKAEAPAEQKPEGEVKHMRQKKEKKPKKQVEKPPEPDPATFIDARIGKIIKVGPVANADKLYEEDVDIGNGVIKHIVSSIRPYYTVEQLQDRKIVIFTNMHPAKMCGVTSEAMLFAGSTPDPDVFTAKHIKHILLFVAKILDISIQQVLVPIRELVWKWLFDMNPAANIAGFNLLLINFKYFNF